MKEKMEQLLSKNPNPVLMVEKDGTVLYSNEAGEYLLQEWGVGVGEKLPSSIGDLVQRVISRNSPEKMEIKVGKRVYLVSFHTSPEDECVNIYGFEISDRKEFEERLLASWEQYRAILENSIDAVLFTSPDGTIYAANPAACQIFGMTEKEIIQGGRNGIQDLSDPRLKPALEERDKTGRFRGELNYRRKDGTIFPGEVCSSLFKDKNGIVRTATIIRDITERKQIEEALQESEEKSRYLIKHAPTGIYEVDFNGPKFKSVNDTMCQMLGYTKEELLALNPFELLDEESKERFRERIRKILAGERVDTSVEYVALGKNGRKLWVVLYTKFIHKDGIAVRAIVVAHDITERKRAEEALRESESCRKVAEAVLDERQRLYNVLETLPVMICLLTPDYHVAFANRAFREKFGESGGRHCYEYCFDRTMPCEFCEAYKVLETGQLHHWKFSSPDGSVFDAYDLPFTDVDGSPMILEMDIDVTEQKKAEEKLRVSEEKYRNIVETANEGILITDSEAIITYVNQKLVDMLGYNLEDFVGKPIWDFISEEYRPIVKLNLEKRMQGISESYELKLIREDSSFLWTFLNAKPLLDKDGKYVGAMSMLTDITKRKEAEEALTNIETARKKEIHHRIKNNLQVISSLLDLQAEQFRNRYNIKDSEVLEAFRESQDRVISMALIHEELYKGGEFETLNFSPYIQELTKNLFKTYSLGDTEIILNMDLEENLLFDMDTAVPLGIIVNELVSNSLKHAFIGRDKGEIRIKLHREENGECINSIEERKIKGCKNTTFILSISDNGVGIPELEIENLDSLGLQLVTSLVDQLEGELELKRDNGTEFIIRFSITEKDNQVSVPAAQQLIE
jgi:PAS domain S-box-containing protein